MSPSAGHSRKRLVMSLAVGEKRSEVLWRRPDGLARATARTICSRRRHQARCRGVPRCKKDGSGKLVDIPFVCIRQRRAEIEIIPRKDRLRLARCRHPLRAQRRGRQHGPEDQGCQTKSEEAAHKQTRQPMGALEHTSRHVQATSRTPAAQEGSGPALHHGHPSTTHGQDTSRAPEKPVVAAGRPAHAMSSHSRLSSRLLPSPEHPWRQSALPSRESVLSMPNRPSFVQCPPSATALPNASKIPAMVYHRPVDNRLRENLAHQDRCRVVPGVLL